MKASLLLFALLYGQSLLLDRIEKIVIDTNAIFFFQGHASIPELRSHVEFLAHDVLRGREAGTPFEKVAAAYLIAQHKRFGHEPLLEQGYVHAFPITSRVQAPKENKKRSKEPPKVDTLYAWNILAAYWGTELPGEYVFLTAHYDHIGVSSTGEVYNGADDNASGTAVLLEAARLISLLPPPKRTVVFFHTSAEEKGLVGAFRFVEAGFIPTDSILAVINLDMLGRVDTLHKPSEGRYMYVIGSSRATPRLKSIQETVNAFCCEWGLDYRYDDPQDPLRLFYRSDHYAFAQKGVPAVFYFGGLHDDYHGTGDDAYKIDYGRLQLAAIFIASLAWTLANQ